MDKVLWFIVTMALLALIICVVEMIHSGKLDQIFSPSGKIGRVYDGTWRDLEHLQYLHVANVVSIVVEICNMYEDDDMWDWMDSEFKFYLQLLEETREKVQYCHQLNESLADEIDLLIDATKERVTEIRDELNRLESETDINQGSYWSALNADFDGDVLNLYGRKR